MTTPSVGASGCAGRSCSRTGRANSTATICGRSTKSCSAAGTAVSASGSCATTACGCPAGAHSAAFQPEYYDLLARSRWVVANDSIDPSYVKREQQTYLQTWHGTPLKKVGQDIEKVNFARKGYLETFAHEVADKWDFLVSPMPTAPRS